MLPRVALPISLLLLLSCAAAQESRHFTFHYGFTVKGVPAGEKVRIWIPAAHSDDFQEVKIVSQGGDLPLKRTRESRFSNEILYATAAKSNKEELHFEIVYDVLRHERVTLGSARPRLAEARLNEKERKEDLAPDKLVPTT